MMQGFDAVAVTFENAERSNLFYHQIRCQELEQYYQEVSKLSEIIRDMDLDQDMASVYRRLRYYQFEPALAPLPFNHDLHRSRVDLPNLEQQVGMVRFTYPQLADSIQVCSELLMNLLSCGANPIQDEVGELVGAFDEMDSVALIVTHSRYVQAVRAIYRDHGIFNIDVLDPNALRGERCWDRMVFIGPVYQKYVDCEFVFSAPRAHSIHIVGFPWQGERWEPQKAFRGGWSGRQGQRVREVRKDQHLALEEFPVSIQDIENRLTGSHPAEPDGLDIGGAQVDARLYGIFGGKGVLIEAVDRKTVLAIDLEGEGESRLLQVSDSDLIEGMYILLRTDSADGYLVPVANQLLGGSARSYRALQARWKGALQAELDRSGMQELSRRLKALGSKRSNNQNIRNWISPTNIRPESDEDFLAIAKCCSMQDCFQEMLRATKEIRSAHQMAGQQVRRQLQAAVQQADTAHMALQGYQEFEVGSLPGAKLTAFRIEHRWESLHAVSASSLERVFELVRS